MRQAAVTRTTRETDITLSLNLDGIGLFSGTSGIGFLDHMLELFARHALIDLQLQCSGDRQVDDHHSVEDLGLVLGDALAQAAGDKRGITRYGFFLLPMDEALVQCALDFSGRAYLAYDLSLPSQKVGEFDAALGEEFFRAVATRAGLTLHLTALRTGNAHHLLEAAFKAFARALRAALTYDARLGNAVPSTKGVL